MAYQKTNWINDQTPLNATNMNHIEDGIADVDQNKLTAQTLSSDTDQAYAKAANGDQKMVDIKTTPQAGAIAEFNSNGNLETGTPQKDTDAANRKYVQDWVETQLLSIGYINKDDVLGVQIDFTNKTFSRLSAAKGLTAGTPFNVFPMYGNRRRCNVADNGTINAFYGDSDYVEDGSNGQVMVYQPKFYYKVVPLDYDKNTISNLGYHLRKVCYYISDKKYTGFKVHPAFKNASGNEIDYILIGTFEGSMYRPSTGTYVSDGADTSTTMDLDTDLGCSVSGKKPISGLHKNLTRTNWNKLCTNRGTGWCGSDIMDVSMDQLLFTIEYGMMNTQSAIGQGVVNITDNSAYNCSSLTGSTASLGNTSGRASSTTNEINSVETAYTDDGRTSISYRGEENFWGNVWKFINGIMIYGNGSQAGGQIYIRSDYDYTHDDSSSLSGWIATGLSAANANGYISSFSYSGEEHDWMFIPSETVGSSSLPVGDYNYVTPNLNGYRIAPLGGSWADGGSAGGFFLYLSAGLGSRNRTFGGRVKYVPAQNS